MQVSFTCQDWGLYLSLISALAIVYPCINNMMHAWSIPIKLTFWFVVFNYPSRVVKWDSSLLPWLSCVSPQDSIGDLKKLIAAQTGTRYDKIVLKKWWAAHLGRCTSAQGSLLSKQLMLSPLFSQVYNIQGPRYSGWLYPFQQPLCSASFLYTYLNGECSSHLRIFMYLFYTDSLYLTIILQMKSTMGWTWSCTTSRWGESLFDIE